MLRSYKWMGLCWKSLCGPICDAKKVIQFHTFKEIGADVIFAKSPLVLRAAFQRRIPFEEGAARVRQEAGICPCAATVLAVVVGERVALVAGVMVLVCNGGIRKG